MGRLISFVLLACCFTAASFTDPPCVIELECAECVPDHMPAVTSHGAAAGAVRVPAGERLALACHAATFLAYPARHALALACEAGMYRVLHDNSLRHLLELGCQDNIFEDVLHPVERCDPPLQGRTYQMQTEGGATRHLAALCFDADRALAVRAHLSNAPSRQLRLPPHAERRAPLSLLGNFNHMFDATTRADADRLYSDDARLNRRLRELLKHARFPFADQYVTAARLLSPLYFDDQSGRVADFASNKVPAWRSVALGNLHHLQRDIAALLDRTRGALLLHLYTGTHGVSTLRSGRDDKELYLKTGRFPVPKYLWAVIHDKTNNRALGVAVLNDPFVSVGEIQGAVFCASACQEAGWLAALRRDDGYTRPLYGLAFCCAAHELADAVPEMPRELIAGVPRGRPGMLLNITLGDVQ